MSTAMSANRDAPTKNDRPKKGAGYHPSYCDKDASLILLSNDDVLFRVHPIILRMAAEVFRDMLNDAKDTEEPVRLGENSDVIKVILDLIYPDGTGLRLSGLNFEFIWLLLNAADKYEIKKIKNEFRVRLLTDSYFATRPLESYAVACRCSWKEEISAASTRCLACVNTPESWDILALLEAKHALAIHKLISVRKQKFIDGWETSKIDSRPTSHYRNYYDRNESGHETFLLALMEQEFLKCPSGKTLSSDFWDRQEISATTDQKDAVQKIVLKILDSLPSTVNDVS